jgi:N-acetylglucosaminyldiphosphoundecaprenol N-acetyl-beta-D-mannosaminyltransferase
MDTEKAIGTMNLPSIKIVGISITAFQFSDQISTMLAWAKQRSSRAVCVANVHMLMESRSNTQLQAALEKADMVTPDGMPLVWVMKALGTAAQDRVAGMDIFLAVCQQCVAEDISIYLLGSTQDVLNKMQSALRRDFPRLKIAGIESPPFRPLTQSEDSELVERINNSGAGFTFVSLGCPKQECWLFEHQGKVESVMVGLGGVFPVYAGIQKRAPKWVRNSGLEWLYRLIQEPRRLFNRYFTTIPPFVVFALLQVVIQKSRKAFSPRKQADFDSNKCCTSLDRDHLQPVCTQSLTKDILS